MYPYPQIQQQGWGRCHIPTAQGDDRRGDSLTTAKGLLSSVYENKAAPSFSFPLCLHLCPLFRFGVLGHAGEGKMAVDGGGPHSLPPPHLVDGVSHWGPKWCCLTALTLPLPTSVNPLAGTRVTVHTVKNRNESCEKTCLCVN